MDDTEVNILMRIIARRERIKIELASLRKKIDSLNEEDIELVRVQETLTRLAENNVDLQ